MKATLNVDDRLLSRARAVAAREGKTLTALVEEALRARLTPGPAGREPFRLILPTVRGTAPPQVDVSDRNALAET